jgi:hypothetical protein
MGEVLGSSPLKCVSSPMKCVSYLTNKEKKKKKKKLPLALNSESSTDKIIWNPHPLLFASREILPTKSSRICLHVIIQIPE